MNLKDFVEQISDDFQSTFTVVDENTLANMIAENEIQEVTNIIKKYLPDIKVSFEKTNQVPYRDIYIIRASDEK